MPATYEVKQRSASGGGKSGKRQATCGRSLRQARVGGRKRDGRKPAILKYSKFQRKIAWVNEDGLEFNLREDRDRINRAAPGKNFYCPFLTLSTFNRPVYDNL